MKEYEKIMVEKVVLSKTTCDRCGNDCTNTYFDIGSRTAFCESFDLIETICCDCWEANFKNRVLENRDNRVKKYKNDALCEEVKN